MRDIPIARTDTNEPDYRTPSDLAIQMLPPLRALVIGSCYSEELKRYLPLAFPGGISADHILFGQGELPPRPPAALADYDFQVIMLALRAVMPEQLYFRLGHSDMEGHEAAFRSARERLIHILHSALAYRKQRPIVTFVANFHVPQQSPMGRMLPRYDLRNPVYFVEQLNRVIADEIAGMAGVHLLDIDQISANLGRKYIQDDGIWLTNHHSVVSDYETELDQERLEVPTRLTDIRAYRVWEYMVAVSKELHAMMRTVRQVDQVKLVIVDLDDTLWRGVVAEDGIDRPMVTEGWPAGVAEALAFLKKRGVLLAIVSKNDEARIRALWPRLYGGRLELGDFASVRINWQPKADNVEQILKEVNLLARNVVFVDDNPVERSNVATAFPGIRTLGMQLYEVRRILLWAPETQVPFVSDESARRTELIQAQVERETSRSRMTRAEFLETLNVTIRMVEVALVTDPRFARCFELLNKSNQFNTTGRRWTAEDAHDAFAAGTVFWAVEVDDLYTNYGIVGVAVLAGHQIAQFAMSCRVIGLDVEVAAIGELVAHAGPPVSAVIIETDANFLCRDLFARCGFLATDGGWVANQAVPRPGHVRTITREPAQPLAVMSAVSL